MQNRESTIQADLNIGKPKGTIAQSQIGADQLAARASKTI